MNYYDSVTNIIYQKKSYLSLESQCYYFPFFFSGIGSILYFATLNNAILTLQNTTGLAGFGFRCFEHKDGRVSPGSLSMLVHKNIMSVALFMRHTATRVEDNLSVKKKISILVQSFRLIWWQTRQLTSCNPETSYSQYSTTKIKKMSSMCSRLSN